MDRDLRISLCLALTALALVTAGCAKRDGESVEAQGEDRVPVVVTPVAMRDFEERLTLQGNVAAKTRVTVVPRIPGILEAIFVDEGSLVVAGETALFQTERLKLEKAVEISRQDLALSKANQREAAANQASVQAQYDKAVIDFERFSRLRERDAVTLDAMEQQTMRHKASKAGLEHAQALIDLAGEGLRKAEAALAIAEKNLSDALVLAPLSGVVSLRVAEPGEMGDPGAPVLFIEDPSLLEVSLFVPAEYYAQIRPGDTHLRVKGNGVDLGELAVSYRSPTIQSALRTFEVKCEIEDPPAGVVSGALAEIDLVLMSKRALGVPEGAVVPRSDRRVLFLGGGDSAQMVEVGTGLSTDGWVEIVDGAVSEGAAVVTMGQFLLDDGTAITRHENGEGS